MDVREDRTALFNQLADPTSISTFFDRVANDVVWTVEGVHPLAGTYRSKQAFVTATFGRLGPLMRNGVRLELRHLILDGAIAVAELAASSTTLEGARYDNHLCWVCRFAGTEVGDSVVEVRAYLDSAMVTWTVLRNEPYPVSAAPGPLGAGTPR